MLRINSMYIRSALDDIERIAVVARARTENVTFDTMVGTGLSGSLVVPRLAEALDVSWLIVRKPGENSHTNQPAEGHLGTAWLFVDDFIATGETQRRVISAVKDLCKAHKHKSKYAGAYLYEDYSYVAPPA